MLRKIFFLILLVAGCSSPEIIKKDIDVNRLVDLHNLARSKWGYKHLVESQDLKEYAKNHAEYMLKNNSLKHSSMSKVIKLGYSYAGENIAWNQQTEDEVMNSWLWSPGHRSNILSGSYDSIGCGVAYDNQNIYWCVVFGKKAKPNYSK